MRLTLTQRVGLFGSLQHAQIEVFVNLADVVIDFQSKQALSGAMAFLCIELNQNTTQEGMK